MFGASCLNRTVLFNLSGCSSFTVSYPLSPVWLSLILFFSCWFSYSPDATAFRSAICSSGSLSLFHSLCLGDAALVCILPCSSRKNSFNNCADSFPTFINVPSMRCQRGTIVRRIFLVQFLESLYNSWQWWSRSFFVGGDTICHRVPHELSQFVASYASLNDCLVQLLPRRTPFWETHNTAPVQS